MNAWRHFWLSQLTLLGCQGRGATILQWGEAKGATTSSYMKQEGPHHTEEYTASDVDSVEAAKICSILCSFESESEFSVD